ncbi:ParB/RepB/Spo0J family partition protein [Candidatus Dependentiae bacterium]|nr:ParB/RepB/Spo0J family partition protein [Candidatus Dependentiae bacterium]
MQKQVLGKGLDALIPENTKMPESPKDNIVKIININKIIPNMYQPRKTFEESKIQELADSIKSKGILNPIIAREEGTDRYQIIAGERRWRAAKIAGIENIPVIIQKVDNKEMLELSIIENIQRDDLNSIEEAEAYQSLLKEFNLTHEEISLRVGKSRTSITNILRLLKLPYEIKDGLRKNIISMGHARAILGLDNEGDMLRLFNTIVNDGISVRETERLVKKLLKQNEDDEESSSKPPLKSKITVEIRMMEEELMEYLGTKVHIKDKKHRGKIVIEYYSLDDFERILDKIKNETS